MYKKTITKKEKKYDGVDSSFTITTRYYIFNICVWKNTIINIYLN